MNLYTKKPSKIDIDQSQSQSYVTTNSGNNRPHLLCASTDTEETEQIAINFCKDIILDAKGIEIARELPSTEKSSECLMEVENTLMDVWDKFDDEPSENNLNLVMWWFGQYVRYFKTPEVNKRTTINIAFGGLGPELRVHHCWQCSTLMMRIKGVQYEKIFRRWSASSDPIGLPLKIRTGQVDDSRKYTSNPIQ